MMRSKDRKGKTTLYDFDVKNLISLAKKHRLTKLIVKPFQIKCKILEFNLF